jgi:hypothetical protein
MFQIVLTPSAGKRLIAKATIESPFIQHALNKGIIAIIAGTTNGYVAEELLSKINQAQDFNRARFFRGVTLPPSFKTTDTGRLPDESRFPGDVVIVNGVWDKGKTIFDVVNDLKEGDVIVKGANCIDLIRKKAGILIGHPKGGTIVTALQAIVGRRVKLILPVGLEKRISDNLDAVADMLNSPGLAGHRLLPVNGEIITEIEACETLFGLHATLIAAGGVCGAEGAVWLSIFGEKEQELKAKNILDEIEKERVFTL